MADNEMIVCGMALGCAEQSAPENGVVPARVPVREFARFHE